MSIPKPTDSPTSSVKMPTGYETAGPASGVENKDKNPKDIKSSDAPTTKDTVESMGGGTEVAKKNTSE